MNDRNISVQAQRVGDRYRLTISENGIIGEEAYVDDVTEIGKHVNEYLEADPEGGDYNA